MTTNEASDIFKIPARKIAELCRLGYVPGAFKNGRWVIPDETAVIIEKNSIETILYMIKELKILRN